VVGLGDFSLQGTLAVWGNAQEPRIGAQLGGHAGQGIPVGIIDMAGLKGFSRLKYLAAGG